MAIIDGPKYTGPLTIDLTSLKDKLIDVPSGGLKGARAEKKDTIGKVVEELATAIPAYGEAANIAPSVYKRFLERTADLAELRASETTQEKMLEVTRETRVKIENDREDDISIMAKAAQNAAKKNPGILAPFENTIAYNSQFADKAAETRRKNEEASAIAAAATETAAKDTAAAEAAKKADGQMPPV
jgi:hypothetical protein